MTRYTLIAYREEYTESYRSCVVDSSGSNHQIIHETKIEPIIDKILDFEEWNANRNSNYDEYTLTLLRNGRSQNLLEIDWCKHWPSARHHNTLSWRFDDQELNSKLETARNARKCLRMEEAETTRRAAEEEGRRKDTADAEAKRQRDLAELSRLQALYGEIA